MAEYYKVPQALLLSLAEEKKVQDKKYPNQEHTLDEWIKIAQAELNEAIETNDINKKRCEVVATLLCLLRGMGNDNGHGNCQYCSGKCLRDEILCPPDCNIFWGETIKKKE